MDDQTQRNMHEILDQMIALTKEVRDRQSKMEELTDTMRGLVLIGSENPEDPLPDRSSYTKDPLKSRECL